MVFNMKPLRWECSCGIPRVYVQGGINSLGEFVAKWRCLKCKKWVMATIPLEKLIADIPIHPQLALPTPQFIGDDQKFLKEMHICDPIQGEGLHG